MDSAISNQLQQDARQEETVPAGDMGQQETVLMGLRNISRKMGAGNVSVHS